MATSKLSPTHIEPGVWKVQVGRQDRPTLTDASESRPRQERLRLLGDSALPFLLSQVVTEATAERSTAVLPLEPDEKIFGLGLQMQGCNRRGEVFHLRVDHYSKGHDRLHVPTPLYISSKGYAVFFNTARPIDIYVGVGNRLLDPSLPKPRDRNTDKDWDSQPDSGHVEASVQGKGLEILIFSGPSALAALQRYNLFCGGGCMPPKWALGFWNRTPSLANANEVLDEIAEFKRRGFPLDVIGLEPGWESTSYPGTMEWSPGRFPNPKGFLEAAASLGVHVNLWENPYIRPGSNLFQKVAPDFGSHMVWLGAVPDLRMKHADDVLAEFHRREHLDLGVTGYKIDEIDGFDNWLWPDHANFPSGLDGLRMRQIYGLLWQDQIDKWFRFLHRRTFGLIRGSNGAASRFPFAIYSDTYDHREYVTALTNSSLAGTLWCAEAREATTPEEWVRRMQSACMSPIAQLNAWSSGTKPWSFPSVDSEIKKAMVLREQLSPYLYTVFFQYYRDGIPPILPMCLVDGGTETDQYLLGPDLLVAPAFAGESSRKVRLPAGLWIEFDSGKSIEGDRTIEVKPSLDTIPVYVRSGSIIPMVEATDNLSNPTDHYLLGRFGAGPWSGTLYEDDGVSFGYESGKFGLFKLSVGLDGSVRTEHLAGDQLRVKKSLKIL